MDNETLVKPVEAAPSAETQEKAARWEDLIDIYFTPRQLFQRRAEDKVGPPLFMLLAFAIVVYFILTPVNAMIMRVTLAADPQGAEALAAMESMEGLGTLMQVFGAISVPVQYLMSIVSGALVLWIGGKIFGIKAGFSRMLLIATYAAFVMPIWTLASGLLMYLHGEVGLDILRHGSIGLARFFGGSEAGPLRTALLAPTELFAVWRAVLWGIGLAVVCKADRGRAAALAGVAWVIVGISGAMMALAQMAGPGS